MTWLAAVVLALAVIGYVLSAIGHALGAAAKGTSDASTNLFNAIGRKGKGVVFIPPELQEKPAEPEWNSRSYKRWRSSFSPPKPVSEAEELRRYSPSYSSVTRAEIATYPYF